MGRLMNPVSHVKKFLRRDLWRPDSTMLKGWSAFSIKTLRLVVVAVSDFRDGALSLRATSLVSTTLLSLVPFLAVMFSVLKAFGVHQQIEPVLDQALEPLGQKGEEITTRVIEFVNDLQLGALGAVGVAGLFYTTFSLIDKIEEALNHIWRVRHARPLARKFTDYLSVVLVGPVMVFTAVAAVASAQSHWLVQTLLQIEPLEAAVIRATALMPVALICVGFTFLYKFLPHTQVNLVSAFVGGGVAGVLWQLAGMLFTGFVAGSVRYSAIYSSFAILILFLIWLYVAWLIVLVGAQVAYYHQHPEAYLTRLRWKHKTAAFREYVALNVLVLLIRRHAAGEPPVRTPALSAQLGVPLSAVEDILEDFLEHRLIYRTAEPEGITLGRHPDRVTALEVLQITWHKEWPRPDVGQQDHDPVDALLRQRDQAVHDALQGVTLTTLAADAPAALPSPGPSSSFVKQPAL